MGRARRTDLPAAGLLLLAVTGGLAQSAISNSAPELHDFPNLPAVRAQADAGDSGAQTRLGDYHLSLGDATNAVIWYRKAAD